MEYGLWLLEQAPAEVARIALESPPTHLETMDAAIAAAENVQAAELVPWRSDPASLAHHLTEGTYTLWSHVELLSRKFVDAIEGRDVRQLWNLPSQVGKGLALDTPIPTPSGWTTMGALKVGDEVFGGDGEPCRVTFATEPQVLDCYRVELWDGAVLVADGDHRWKVWDPDSSAYRVRRGGGQQKGAWKVVNTRALAKVRRRRYLIPRMPGLKLPERELPLMRPYVLGVWLGDGSSSGPELTCADDELLEHLAAESEPCRRAPATADPYRCTWAGSHRKPGTFKRRLRALGVLDNKHVPEEYLWAGEAQRLALLQGLMDTDGYCGTNTDTGYSLCEFTSTKVCLAEAVRFLARSLGIRAKMSEGRATIDGRDCGPKWRVNFTTAVPVFRLTHKLVKLYDIPHERKKLSNAGVRSVTSIEPVPTRCIQVNSIQATYLAGDHLTVTHNTTLLMRCAIWALDRDPSARIMYVSYDADKAVREAGEALDFAREHRDVLRFDLRPDIQARGRWNTRQGGGIYATGVGGSIVGYPASVMLGDDLLGGWVDAHSARIRATVWNIYKSQMRMRMQSESDPIVLAGTRWHPLDPTGMALSEQGLDVQPWTLIRIPHIAEEPNLDDPIPEMRLPDPLGREPGEPLQRFSLAEVLARSRSLGSYLSAGLEQQRPAPEEGGELKRAWWKWATSLPPAYDDAVASWDTAFRDKETSDFVVGQVWGRTGADFWMAEQIRGHFGMGMTQLAIALLAVRHPYVTRHYVENAGAGPEVMEQLRIARPDFEITDEQAGQLGMTEVERAAVQAVVRRGVPGILPVNPKGSKEVRARAEAGLLEAGNCHLLFGDPGALSLVEEAASFPNSINDDQVDAWSQAMSKLRRGAATVAASSGQVTTARASTSPPRPGLPGSGGLPRMGARIRRPGT